MASIDVSSSWCQGHIVVALGGELDICGAGHIGRALRAAAGSGSRIIVDLAALSFIDCAGLAALASARRQAREAGGDLLLAAAARPVARLLSLTGELPLFATVSEAASGDPRAPAAVGLAPGSAALVNCGFAR